MRHEMNAPKRDVTRGLGTAGEVTLKVPKMSKQTLETAIIERYRRRESSVEEALIEMHLAGVFVRRCRGLPPCAGAT